MLKRVHGFILDMLALRLICVAAHAWWGIDLPYIVTRYVMLEFIAFFAIGIMIYRLNLTQSESPKLDWAVMLASIAVIAIADSPRLAGVCVGLAALLYFASRGQLRLLRAPPLLWLGAISYSLYLIHENIGWAALRYLQGQGWSLVASISIVTVGVLTLATLMTYGVEKPAMRAIRALYKRNTKPVN